jgi:hypothetical protein
MTTSATVKDVMAFFGMSAKEFMVEWKLCSDKDKSDLKDGIGNGTLTY